jgi:hypothetical protein
MCQRVTCPSCGKPTYAGCGMHVEQVLGNVPKSERCRCREEKSAAGASKQASGGSVLDKLFGK